MSFFPAATHFKEPDIPIVLTAQEKKVIGFVAFLFVLGLAVLGFRSWLD